VHGPIIGRDNDDLRHPRERSAVKKIATKSPDDCGVLT
jgi:hypothetical protein